MYNALISGLDDYTVDERGDVGSWVRIASIQGLTSVSVTLLTLAKTDTAYIEYIPASLYQKAIAGILKQGVGRLDNVRQHAGESIHCLLKCPLPSVGDANPWKFHGENLFKELLLRYQTSQIVSDVFLTLFKSEGAAEDRSHSWQNSPWIFPKAMRFLEVPEYRPAVLAGLLISIGSKTDSTVNISRIHPGVRTPGVLTIIFVSNVTPAIVLFRTRRAFRQMLVTVEAITYKPSSKIWFPRPRLI